MNHFAFDRDLIFNNAMARLLVFEPRMLGDAILSLPFVRGAMEQHEVTVCCPPKSAPIYRWILPPERVVEWDVAWDSIQPCGEKWRQFQSVRGHLRAQRFDTVVSVWPDARVHLWMALLGIPQRIGFPMNRTNYYGWQRPWRGRQLRIGQVLEWLGTLSLARPLLTQKITKHDAAQAHWAEWKQLSEALGTPWRDDFPWLNVGGEAHPELRQFVNAERAAKRSIWMIHPGARVPSKQWSLERFQELADHYFPAHNVSLIFIEPPGSSSLATHSPHHFSYRAATLDDLARAVSLIDGLLCNDSMISHLATALGKKVVSVFGPSQISWFAPYRNESYVAAIDICPHRPCLDRCLMPSPVCIEQLDIETVRSTLDRALAAAPLHD